MRSESGQASLEWTGVVCLVALVLGAAVAFVPAVDGRSFGSVIAHSIVCAVKGGCDSGDDALRAAYGATDAELVRRFAPNIVYEPGTHTFADRLPALPVASVFGRARRARARGIARDARRHPGRCLHARCAARRRDLPPVLVQLEGSQRFPCSAAVF